MKTASLKSQLVAATGLALVPFIAAGCSDDESTAAPAAVPGDVAAITAQAERAAEADPAGLAMPGLWRTKSQVEGGGVSAWADLIWIVGEREAWHVVSVFADEELTIPLVRWDIVRAYEVGGAFSISTDASELNWRDISSWITAFVDAPPLLQALGIDDCQPEVTVPLDSSQNNCAAPFFPYRDCELMDFAEIREQQLTFGDPQATDRCVERVDSYEAWSFARVPFTPDVYDVLDQRPEGL